MIDFQKPVDPFEHVKISESKAIGEEEEEKRKKQHYERIQVSKKLFIYLAFLKIFSNILKIFTFKKPKPIDQTPLHHELETIKSSLEALENKDFCQDPEFLNFFAFIWMKFLQDYSHYSLRNEEITKLIRQLITEINEYPKDAEFSLGYYISEFAGYRWIPFPYMEILRNLHLEDKKDPENSHLKKWIGILDELMRKI